MSATVVPTWKPWAIGGATGFLVAMIGGTLTNIGPWYQALRKPWFQPPDWLFAPAWTLIFTLCVISGVLAWRATIGHRGARDAILALFLVNGILNILWSYLFFTLRRPDWAFVEVIFLWGSIVALIIVIWRFSRTASLLLVPYLVWVSFASILNFAIFELNRPFS